MYFRSGEKTGDKTLLLLLFLRYGTGTKPDPSSCCCCCCGFCCRRRRWWSGRSEEGRLNTYTRGIHHLKLPNVNSTSCEHATPPLQHDSPTPTGHHSPTPPHSIPPITAHHALTSSHSSALTDLHAPLQPSPAFTAPLTASYSTIPRRPPEPSLQLMSVIILLIIKKYLMKETNQTYEKEDSLGGNIFSGLTNTCHWGEGNKSYYSCLSGTSFSSIITSRDDLAGLGSWW